MSDLLSRVREAFVPSEAAIKAAQAAPWDVQRPYQGLRDAIIAAYAIDAERIARAIEASTAAVYRQDLIVAALRGAPEGGRE